MSKITLDLAPPVIAWLEQLSAEAVKRAQEIGLDVPTVQSIEQVATRQLELAYIAAKERG